MVDVMKRVGTLAFWVALAAAALLPLAGASAQSGSTGERSARATRSVAIEASSQRRVRPPTRLRVYRDYDVNPEDVYPRYYPGRNAVRDCNATYVPEYRPSGTVIVPRMSCFWRPG
jgi:hypothetical protein